MNTAVSNSLQAVVFQVAPLLDISLKPKSSDAYIWCDFVELRCLTSIDHSISRDQLSEILADYGKTIGSEQPDDIEIFSSEDDEDDEGEESTDAAAVAEIPIDDKYSAKSRSVFNYLAFRAKVFGNSYPFEIDGNLLKLKDPNSDSRLLYLQLLLCASLRLVDQNRWDELTEPFEEMSHIVWKAMMPATWEVHRFGAKGASQKFKGTKWVRMQALAKAINEKNKLQQKHYKGKSGDAGLDLVAWHPMGGDGRMGVPISFGQCGCTSQEWSMKMLSASPGAMNTHFTFHHASANYYFMPQDLTEADGTGGLDWQRKEKITSAIVVDRLRFINLATSYGVLNECLLVELPVLEAYMHGALYS